ncbi:MAG: hypothetical protein ACREJM_12895 [Candidatus Saccharimonadales bacterium]
MLIDRSQRVWCWTTLALLAVASGAYVVYARRALEGPRGGSVPGLIFGIIGSALMIYAGLISARKKAPTWRIGSAQTWLRGHLWLGSLSIPLILFHAGFRWGGPVEQALLAVLAAIVASGVFGLLLQQFLPRQMTSRVPLETFYAQVPHVCRVLEVEADVAVAELCGPLPLAISQGDPVATVERLNQLGVSGRNPLTSVYAMPGEAAPPAASAATPKPATQNVREVTEPPPPKRAAKATSAADKIAMMRAAKAAKQTSDGPEDAAAETPASAVAEVPTKPKAALSAADKIAMMRAAKSGKELATSPPIANSAAAAAPVAASTTAAKPTSAAEKIALMRAGKAALAGKGAPATAPSAASSSTAAKAETPPVKPAPSAKPAPDAARKKPQVADDWKHARPEFVRFYLEQVRPFLGAGYLRQSLLADGVQAEGQFAAIGAVLPEPMQLVVRRLASLCEERRQLATQVRIHHWLHGWLLLHVPLSVALLALGVVHVVASLYY